MAAAVPMISTHDMFYPDRLNSFLGRLSIEELGVFSDYQRLSLKRLKMQIKADWGDLQGKPLTKATRV